MTKPVFVQGPGVFVSADVAAAIRHGLLRELKAAHRRQERVHEDVVATIQLLDTVGAAWAKKNLPDVPLNVPSLDSPDSDAVEWTTVTSAAEVLQVSSRAVTGLLTRRSLHGEQVGRSWRVCGESVRARAAGNGRCGHLTQGSNS